MKGVHSDRVLANYVPKLMRNWTRAPIRQAGTLFNT